MAVENKHILIQYIFLSLIVTIKNGLYSRRQSVLMCKRNVLPLQFLIISIIIHLVAFSHEQLILFLTTLFGTHFTEPRIQVSCHIYFSVVQSSYIDLWIFLSLEIYTDKVKNIQISVIMVSKKFIVCLEPKGMHPAWWFL